MSQTQGETISTFHKSILFNWSLIDCNSHVKDSSQMEINGKFKISNKNV
jgi:hypothetical protein